MSKQSHIEKMKSYYDHRAPWHDEYMSFQSFPEMEKLYYPIIEKIIPLITNKSVLEIACGTGNWTHVFAKRATSVTAVDASRKSLQIAEEKLNPFDNISLICTDAYSLESLKKQFDVIIAIDWFSHIPKSQIGSFLQMLNTIVKPNSSVIFCGMLENQYFKDENHIIDRDNNRVSSRKLPDGARYDVIKNFFSENELLEIFSKFGSDLLYTEFDSLNRWLIEYKTK